MIKYCVTGVLAILLPLSAQAESPDFEKELKHCSLLESSLQRLDCYDELARQLQGDEGSAKQQATRGRGAEARTERGRSDFGLENRRSEEAEDKIYIEIVEKWQNPRGAWRFRTADGHEWHQTQVQRSFQFDDDENYFIQRGAFNSFNLGFDGSNRTTRIRRVN